MKLKYDELLSKFAFDFNLRSYSVDEKGWERAVNVAYRKASLRTHPDKHPAHMRDLAEAAFKRLNLSHKVLLRVGAAIRAEAEHGNDLAAAQRMVAEAAALEEARLASQLGRIMSMDGRAVRAVPFPQPDMSRHRCRSSGSVPETA